MLKLWAALVAGGVTYVLLHVWRRRSTLVLERDTLRFIGLLGRRKLRAPASAVVAEVVWRSGLRSRRWLFLDGGGATILGLDLTAWELADLEALSRRLGIGRDTDRTPHSPRVLSRIYPGAFPWAITHPFALTAVSITAVSLGLALLAAVGG